MKQNKKEDDLYMDGVLIDITNEKDNFDDIKEHMSPKKRIRRTKEELKTNYVDPSEMEFKIKEYYKTGYFSGELADMIQKIATRLGYAQNFINYCVDEHTQALTQRGWVGYDDIDETDKILSYDIKNQNLVWSDVKGVFINIEYDGLMYKLVSHGLDALVSPGHKFVSMENGIQPIETFLQNEKECMVLMCEGSGVVDDNLKVDTCIGNENICRMSGINCSNQFYKGVIWCPETGYGTFIARRGECVYISGNSYKEEMIGDAVIKMVTALTRHRFKCDSGYNPFSYFTKVAFRAFQNRIKKEKKDHDTIKRYQESVYNLLTESGQIPFAKNSKGECDDNSYDESYETFHEE